ncbi:hypothetical protein [Falsiroseomonas ponticola]|uniref:hypothetical protein n=1 Tax=Falsiroseomonas ponticola TaxID=2786951 RepID=UPI0019324DA2|nr:hypothetical protein [Roseomonas ponticola]
MTVIVSVKINDGIVMASDSASTFQSGQTYLHADKIVNLVKGLPIGVMVTGNGGIGAESIATLLKDLRARLDGSDPHPWKLDRPNYTMQHVAERVREFLFEEKTVPADLETWMRLRICGYSAGRPLPEIWEVLIRGKECDSPKLVQAEQGFGVNWDGEYEALDRLILGVGSGFQDAAVSLGLPQEQAPEITAKVMRQLYEDLAVPAMPIQDAIDLARFLVETTAGFVRFSIRKQPKTVGGPVEIAAITKHEGFRWVQRRHFYSATLNPA